MTETSALLRGATARLAEVGVPSPRVDATALLAHAWGRSAQRVQRSAILRDPVPAQVAHTFEELVAERARRVPLQHLTGEAWFRRVRLQVGPGVFVPRPETELLVDLAVQALPAGGTCVDLCTGSGAIALAIKQERPDAAVHGVELSRQAFAWACRNRDALDLDVHLELGPAQRALPELAGSVDVVVSNPPYIPEQAVPVDAEVAEHDPPLALYGGSADGLRIPLEVAARAARLLRPGGVLVMEHADEQGASLPKALEAQGLWQDICDNPDLNGRPRAVRAVRCSGPG